MGGRQGGAKKKKVPQLALGKNGPEQEGMRSCPAGCTEAKGWGRPPTKAQNPSDFSPTISGAGCLVAQGGKLKKKSTVDGGIVGFGCVNRGAGEKKRKAGPPVTDEHETAINWGERERLFIERERYATEPKNGPWTPYLSRRKVEIECTILCWGYWKAKREKKDRGEQKRPAGQKHTARQNAVTKKQKLRIGKRKRKEGRTLGIRGTYSTNRE